MLSLNTPLEVRAYDDYFQSLTPEPVTTMAGKRGKNLNTIGTPGTAVPILTAPFYQLESVPGLTEDTIPRPYGSPTDYIIGTPDTTVPILTAPLLTDKTVGLASVPETGGLIYTNPSVEGLYTLQLPGSPLVNNLQDQPAVLSGSDPLPTMAVAASSAEEQTSADGPDPDCLIPGAVTGCYLRKSVAKETGIFVVGALILVVGIYAMTR